MAFQLLNSSLTFYIGLTVLLQLISISSCQSYSDDCTTPTGQRGQCINIRQCPSVIYILNNAPRPLPQSIRETLASLSCGFEGRSPKVCCRTTTSGPGGNNQQLRDPAQPDYYSETPPAVEGHQNLRLLPANCGIQQLVDYREVFGGNETKLYEFPWMTLLSYNTPRGQQFKCGGTIINNRYILTAAHCLKNLGRGDVLTGVRVGEHDINKEVDCEKDSNECAPPYQDLTIEEAIPHPSYIGFTTRGRTSRLQHDVGLIRVASPMDLSQRHVKSICIPHMKAFREKPLDRAELYVSGWGFTEEGTTSPYLLKVELPYAPNEECGRLLNNTVGDGVGFRQLCAGGLEGMDACGGDSGGPLQVEEYFEDVRARKYVQYGIVSFGPRRCGTTGVPAVYTRVSHYVKWILDTIRP